MPFPPFVHLHPDPHIPEWLVSDPVAVPLLNRERLPFIFGDVDDTESADAERAVNNFLGLTIDARSHAAPHLFRYYARIKEAIGEDEIGVQISGPDEIWTHVKGTDIFVQRRSPNGLIYITIHAECSWEREHGVQLVYRRGSELSRVSEQDGHLTYSEAYGLGDEDDRIDG